MNIIACDTDIHQLDLAYNHEESPGNVLISLNGNQKLGQEVSDILNLPLCKTTCKKYNDGEINFQVNQTIRGHDVYIIQSVCNPVHDNLMELVLAITACRRASANTITVFCPYLAYSRVDRMKPGETVAAADVVQMLSVAGADSIFTVDVHRRQIEGFCKIERGAATEPTLFDSLESLRLSIPNIIEKDLFNLVIVCLSSTGVTRAKKYLELLRSEGVDGELAFVAPSDAGGSPQAEEVICHHKVHSKKDHILIGELCNSDVLIIDDMIDTGSRMCDR
eukprot:UN30509